jgi:hypothetical protein
MRKITKFIKLVWLNLQLINAKENLKAFYDVYRQCKGDGTRSDVWMRLYTQRKGEVDFIENEIKKIKLCQE